MTEYFDQQKTEAKAWFIGIKMITKRGEKTHQSAGAKPPSTKKISRREGASNLIHGEPKSLQKNRGEGDGFVGF